MPAEFLFEGTDATVTGQYIQLAFFGFQQFFIPAWGLLLDTDDNCMPVHFHVCMCRQKGWVCVRINICVWRLMLMAISNKPRLGEQIDSFPK